MALILWSPSFSVGNDRLDADHIIIISLINQLDEVKVSGGEEAAIAPILSALIDYAVGHFRREEELMRRAGYAGLARHVDEHRLLEEQLGELAAAYGGSGDPELSQEIMELLHFWIVDHILKCDMAYKETLARSA